MREHNVLMTGNFTGAELDAPKLEAGRLSLLSSSVFSRFFGAHTHLLALCQEAHFLCSALEQATGKALFHLGIPDVVIRS